MAVLPSLCPFGMDLSELGFPKKQMDARML